MGMIRIGISGWRYEPWRGVFYPKDLAQRRELEFASRAFPTIELNGSFYSLQHPASYQTWYDETPDDFVFAIKGGRYITHLLRLKNCESAMANFFASGIFNLCEKTGPFLWQFPPQFRYDEERFENFFRALPRDYEAALKLARRRDARMTGRCRLAIDCNRPLRHAVEIRHESFVDERFIAQLRRHRIALVVADTAGKWPYYEDVTADFMYIRLHGDAELYVSGYTDAALERWAQRIRAWAGGAEPDDAKRISEKAPPRRRSRDVYCYFDNDVKVRAPIDAHNLMRKLGLPVKVHAAVVAETPESFVPEALDALPYALPRQDTRWHFGPRVSAAAARRLASRAGPGAKAHPERTRRNP
ncbi:MAG TPA: DUF72 domain-containing protein [Burkholderiales bacterium]|nr:DUF72 domain-containing protein [Burkholderiales bacterium]